MKVSEADQHNDRFPAGRWSDATITLKDGRVLDSGDVSARGGFDTPLELSEVRDKFHMMTQATLPSSRASEIWDTCFDLLSEDGCFSKLAELVCAPIG